MRWMLALVAVGTLAGCPADDVPGEPDAATGTCRYLEEGIHAVGAAPLGQWSVAWVCQGGCGGSTALPAPAITAATTVTIAPGSVTWTGPTGTIEQVAATSDGACWVVAPAEMAGPNDCRSSYRLCMEQGVLRANPVHWYDKASEFGQRWRVDSVP